MPLVPVHVEHVLHCVYRVLRKVQTYKMYVWISHFVRLDGHSPNVLQVRLDQLFCTFR